MEGKVIILDIENTNVKCDKKLLISNSDYFKAMFEGNFVEKERKKIKIKNVDLRSMNIILTILKDSTYNIEDEDVLMILDAACMLQFCQIKTMCLERIDSILCCQNSLKIWLVTDLLDLKPISLKAYYISLIEFLTIKDGDSILELNLPQLKKYLGDTKLRTDNELTVFQIVMKWWCENSAKCEKSNLLNLLSCVDYRSLPKNHFQDILMHPGIVNSDIENILMCCYNIIYKKPIEGFSESCMNTAALLCKTNRREIDSAPCILANLKEPQNVPKKIRTEGAEKVVYYDKFGRKLIYEKLCCEKLGSTENNDSHILYFDQKSNQFKNLLTVKEKLEGFHLIGYKECVLIFGGEFIIGRGQWNETFWYYDSLNDRWQKRKKSLSRRHFQACIVGSKLYIAGGTGLYRKNQSNLLWYDFVKKKWSKKLAFPVFIRQLKCCDFMDKFFLVNINERRGYFLNDVGVWSEILIKIEDDLLDLQFEFSIFSYMNKMYIKGKKLVELIFTNNELVVSSIKVVTNENYDNMESTVCNNIVYTLYKQQIDDYIIYTLESYDLDTGDNKYIFKDLLEDDVIKVGNDDYSISPSLKIFSLSHYSIVENRKLVNDSFL